MTSRFSPDFDYRGIDGKDPVIRGLYSPGTGKVGCALLQATLGDQRVSRIFSAKDWFLSPVDDMVLMDAKASEWEMVASWPIEYRIERWERKSK